MMMVLMESVHPLWLACKFTPLLRNDDAINHPLVVPGNDPHPTLNYPSETPTKGPPDPPETPRTPPRFSNPYGLNPQNSIFFDFTST